MAIKDLWNMARHWRGRDRFDAELDEEMRAHLEMRADEFEEQGMPREEALLRARREFGSVARIQEETRDAWRLRWLEDLVSDLRHSTRAMRHAPGFALAAIFSLALGTGANTAMFSLTSEFLLSEPTVEEPRSLAILRVGGASHSPQTEYRFLKDARIFNGLAGMREEGGVNWRQGDETSRLNAVRVTDNYFSVTGTPVWLGRGIQEGETDSVVLHHAFWRNRLGAREDIVGRMLVLDGRAFRVAGVLPPDHRTLVGFGFTPDLYLPVTAERELVKMIARLPAGMAHGQALERLQAAGEELDRALPPAAGVPRKAGMRVEGVTSLDRLSSRKMVPLAVFFGMLMVVSGLVLLVACVNVASLNLARAESRRQELSIRIAMGASRGRIVRQMLTESLALAGVGTACGLALNAALARWANGLALPLPVPVRLDIHPDWRLTGYATLVALGSALVSGWIPALSATRRDVQPGLKHGERNVQGGRRRIRSVLVAAQLAVTTVLLCAGLLFLRNLGQASNTDPGFDVARTTWAAMRVVPERYGTHEQWQAVAVQALQRIRGIPGVETAALADVVPLNDSMTIGTDMKTDLNPQGKRVRAQINRVSPDYFRTMGIALTAGRDFSPSDRTGAAAVTIVNENLAARLFGGQSPVGHTIKWDFAGGVTELEVVGVARNSKYFTLGEEESAAFYTPWMQSKERGAILHLLARSGRPADGLGREIRDSLLNLDGSAAVEVRPMRSALTLAFLPSRAGAWLLGCMGALGLLLAALGLYGVLAYSVSRRVREFGVRMALGASPSRVLRMVFGHGFALVLVGAGAGIGIALLATQPLAMFLVPGVRPGDAITYLLVALLLAGVGLAATVGPALRAVRVEPAGALRQE